MELLAHILFISVTSFGVIGTAMAALRPFSKSKWIFLAVLLAMSCLFPYHTLAHGDDADHGDQKPNLRAKGLIVVKIWCLVIVFLGTFAGGVSPYFCKWNESLLILGTQFAGGVFMGTALMHFLSDSNETFEKLSDKEYPFAFMLSTAGYLMTMSADCLIMWVNQTRKTSGDVEKVGNPKEEGAPSASRYRLAESLLLISALCFHSVFEGIAIGVAESEGDAWRALWTVCLHKIFAAIAMGIALLRMMPQRPFLSCVAYAFAFGISSPIGVAIGIVIDATTEGPVADWIYAISMGIATGVFVYVAINHLLRPARCTNINRNPDPSSSHNTPSPTSFYNLLAVVLGAGVIAVVMIWDT